MIAAGMGLDIDEWTVSSLIHPSGVRMSCWSMSKTKHGCRWSQLLEKYSFLDHILPGKIQFLGSAFASGQRILTQDTWVGGDITTSVLSHPPMNMHVF